MSVNERSSIDDPRTDALPGMPSLSTGRPRAMMAADVVAVIVTLLGALAVWAHQPLQVRTVMTVAGLLAAGSAIVAARSHSLKEARPVWILVAIATPLFVVTLYIPAWLRSAPGDSSATVLVRLAMIGAFAALNGALWWAHGSGHRAPSPKRIAHAWVQAMVQPWTHLRSTDRTQRIVDASLVVTSLATLYWHFLGRPIMATSESGLLRAIDLLYPLMGLTLIGQVAAFAVHDEGRVVPPAALVRLLAGGLVLSSANALRASVQVYVQPAAFTSAGLWLRVLESGGLVCLATAAWSAGSSVSLIDLPHSVRRQALAASFRTLYPVVFAVAVGALVVVRDYLPGHSLSLSSVVGVSVLAALLIRRQTVLSYQSLDLAKNLDELVKDRTLELSEQSEVLASQHSQLAEQAVELIQRQTNLERQQRRLAALHSITVAANASLDNTIVLRRALETLVQLIPNSWGAGYAVTEDGATLMVPMWEHVAPRLRPSERMDPVPAGPACPLPRGEWDCVQIPLVSRDRILAVLQFGLLDGQLLDDDLRLLDAVSGLVGSALENARLYKEAREMADRDPITGLLNHRALKERLEQEIHQARRQERSLAVIVMDLNNFKLFNDTYGHPIGDRVLKSVGLALKHVCRAGDSFGRHGGDEFLAILPDCGADGAIAVADRINDFLASNGVRVEDEDRIIPVSVSSGIAIYPQDAMLRDTLLAYADENMYQSKRHGGRAVAASTEVRALRHLREGESFGVLDAMVWAVDNKDSYTRRHSDEVTRYSVIMAEELGWEGTAIHTLRMAGMLHDVGKIGVPDSILRKPQRLTHEEEAIMRQHPILGAMLVAAIPEMAEILPGVRSHHERWDGKGYPDGLAGEEIPVMGRLMAVPDAFSAMTTDRPYRKALPLEVAIGELIKGAGTQFDGTMVETFLTAVVPRLKLEREEDERGLTDAMQVELNTRQAENLLRRRSDGQAEPSQDPIVPASLLEIRPVT